MSRTSTVCFVLAYAAACSPDVADDGTAWEAETRQIGDTTVVRTVSGSVWGGSVTLIEELAIGSLEGAEEMMFGRIDAIAADGAGGVYVFDRLVPALRYYDAEGRYIRTLGGEGSGPGEHRNIALGLAVRTDGRVVMQDARNVRLNVYDSTGAASESWHYNNTLFEPAMVLDTADHMYLKILLSPPERGRPWNIGLLHLDDQGNIVDTIAPPAIAGEPVRSTGRFLPTKRWAWSPLGYMVAGLSDRYRFSLWRADGSTLRIEREVPTVPILDDERSELEAQNEWFRQHPSQFATGNLPTLPSSKVSYRALYADGAGRIWVWRHVEAERIPPEQRPDPVPDRAPPLTWQEPVVFDVFEPTGEYLGEVSVPARTTIHVFGVEKLWGVRTGDFDEQYVVRLRLETSDR